MTHAVAVHICESIVTVKTVNKPSSFVQHKIVPSHSLVDGIWRLKREIRTILAPFSGIKKKPWMSRTTMLHCTHDFVAKVG